MNGPQELPLEHYLDAEDIPPAAGTTGMRFMAEASR